MKLVDKIWNNGSLKECVFYMFFQIPLIFHKIGLEMYLQLTINLLKYVIREKI